MKFSAHHLKNATRLIEPTSSHGSYPQQGPIKEKKSHPNSKQADPKASFTLMGNVLGAIHVPASRGSTTA